MSGSIVITADACAVARPAVRRSHPPRKSYRSRQLAQQRRVGASSQRRDATRSRAYTAMASAIPAATTAPVPVPNLRPTRAAPLLVAAGRAVTEADDEGPVNPVLDQVLSDVGAANDVL